MTTILNELGLEQQFRIVQTELVHTCVNRPCSLRCLTSCCQSQIISVYLVEMLRSFGAIIVKRSSVLLLERHSQIEWTRSRRHSPADHAFARRMFMHTSQAPESSRQSLRSSRAGGCSLAQPADSDTESANQSHQAKSYALGVVTSPFTLQLHHSLHCSHGCQMDMPLENPFGVHDGDGYRKAYFEEWEQAAPASPQSVHDDLSQWHTSCCPNQHMRFHHDHTLSEEELFACLTRSDPQGEGDRLCVPAGTQKLTDDGGSTPYGSPPTPQGFHLLRSRPGSPTQIQVLHRSLGSSASTWNHLTNQ